MSEDVNKYLRNEHKKGRFKIWSYILKLKARYGLSQREATEEVYAYVKEYSQENNPSGEKSYRKRKVSKKS